MITLDLSPENLLTAYANGIFPMADDQGEIHWFSPDPRAIIELETFKASRSLRAAVRQGLFEVTINREFDSVIARCADRAEGTWISDRIARAYQTLHRLGFAHSVESWRDGQLAGGLYGVSLYGAFFGESMFHQVTDASKVALVCLIERMRERGLVLLDVQFMTEHLRTLGAIEISAVDYGRRLAHALSLSCTFADPPSSADGSDEDRGDAADG